GERSSMLRNRTPAWSAKPFCPSERRGGLGNTIQAILIESCSGCKTGTPRTTNSSARTQRGSFECRTRLKFRFRRQLRSVLLLSAFPQPTEAVERIRRQRSEYPVPDCAVPLLAAPLSYRPPERRTSHSGGLHCCKLR